MGVDEDSQQQQQQQHDDTDTDAPTTRRRLRYRPPEEDNETQRGGLGRAVHQGAVLMEESSQPNSHCGIIDVRSSSPEY